MCCIQNSCPGDITRGIDKMQKNPVLNMHNSLTNGKVHVGAIWLEWSILTTHLYGTYKGHVWDLRGTYKSLPYIPYKPHIGETVTVVPGIYLLVDTMHVYNR